MKILNNLFSIFDPSCSTANAAWMNMLILLLLLMTSTSSKFTLTSKMTASFISKELSQSSNHSSPLNMNMFLTFFIMIYLFNLSSLIPLSFTLTAQILISFSLATAIMMSIWSFDWKFNMKKSLAHLCPIGVPTALAVAITLIEFISMIIRPITLSVRLTANMMAGHLLMSLLFGAMSLMNLPILSMAAIPLFILELAVSAIQAYVFSMLTSLYKSEIYKVHS